MSSKTGDLKDLEKKTDTQDTTPTPKPGTKTDAGKEPPKPEPKKEDTKPASTEGSTPPAPTPPAPAPADAGKKDPVMGPKTRGQHLTDTFVKPYRARKQQEADEIEHLKKEAENKEKAKAGEKGEGADKGDKTQKEDPGTGAKVQSQDQGAGGTAEESSSTEATSTFDKVDSVMEKIDPFADIAGMGVTHANDGINLYADSMDVMNKEASTASNIAGVVGSGSSMLLNGYGTLRSGMGTHKAKKNGDKVGYRAGIFETAGGALSTMGDMATFGTGIGGLAGGSKNSGDIGNVLSGSLGALGSISSLAGSSYRTNQNKKNRDMLNLFSRTSANMDMDKLNQQKSDAFGKGDLAAYESAQRRRNSAKAMKYATAMGGAAADTKYKSAKWDTLGNVAGLIGSLSSIVGGAIGLAGSSPIAKLVMTGIGALTNIIGSVAKAKNMASEKKRGSENKTRFVNEYITEKKTKILKEANEGVINENEKVTDAEAENIAIARLGINADQPISATSTLDQNRDKVFGILCQKRARNIMGADAHTRSSILENMGLDPEKATEDAIISALGG